MNLVLIVLDTARGDVTNSLIQSGQLPNLETLANNGQYYTEAKANAPWTVPSHGTIFTGKYPSDHGITGDNPAYETVPLVDELRDRGYETACFSANPWLSPEFNFDSSFDSFQTQYDYYSKGTSVSSIIRSSNRISAVKNQFSNKLGQYSISKSLGNTAFWAYQRMRREDSGGKHLLSRTADWLSTPSEDPKFAFINVTEPHLSYSLPSQWLPSDVNRSDLRSVNQDTASYNAGQKEFSDKDMKILRDTYEYTLKYIDHQIGECVKRTSEDTIFIVMGDHGEHFGEYDRFGHQYSLYDELLHVPLIISGAGVDQMKITNTVELKGIYNTLLSFAEGKSDSLEEKENHIAETITPRPSLKTLQEKSSSDPQDYVYQYASGARCISNQGYKLIEFPNGETEFLIEDGSEADDTDSLEESLHSILVKARGEMKFGGDSELDVSEGVKSRLKDLGYA